VCIDGIQDVRPKEVINKIFVISIWASYTEDIKAYEPYTVSEGDKMLISSSFEALVSAHILLQNRI
jgi:hypothetical protein